MTLENNPQTQSQENKTAVPGLRNPNESGTIRVEAYLRISDPKTNYTILEGRA